MKRLLPFVLLAAVALSCAEHADRSAVVESSVTGVPIGQLRGSVDVATTLRVRLLDEADPRTAGFDVARVAGGAVFSLRRQLGAFVPSGTGSEYQGGVPTPFNVMLWHQVLGRFAIAVGETCATGDATLRFRRYAASPGSAAAVFRLAPAVAATVAAACALDGDEGARRRIASSLWDAVMGPGGTLAGEKVAFVEEASKVGSAFAVAGGPGARVTSMVLAMLLNPHFLLAK